jgi:hypothetical protein
MKHGLAGIDFLAGGTRTLAAFILPRLRHEPVKA